MRRRAFFISALGAANTLSGCAEIDIPWGDAHVSSFETFGSNLDSIRSATSRYSSVAEWKEYSIGGVGLAGFGLCAVPLAAAAALPADFAILMNQIYDSSMGIGFLRLDGAIKTDFANILAIWSDELHLNDETFRASLAMAYDVANDLGEEYAEDKFMNWMRQNAERSRPKLPEITHTSTHPSVSSYSTVLAHKTGAKVSGKLGGKVAAKAGAKIGAKYGAKAAFSWVPVASGLVCGGLNSWIMSSILDSADEYFSHLERVQSTIAINSLPR